MSNKHWNEFGRWLSACFAIVCVDILYEMSVQNGCNPHCMSSMQRFGWNRTMLFSFLMCNNWIVAWIEFNWLTFPIFMPSICAWADSRKKEEETGIEESYQNADIALILLSLLSIGRLLLIVECVRLWQQMLLKATIKAGHIYHGTIGPTAFLLTQKYCYQAIQMKMIVKFYSFNKKRPTCNQVCCLCERL